MSLCLMCAPRLALNQRQTLLRECPKCGTQSDLGGQNLQNRLTAVCFACGAPLFKRKTIKPKNTRKGKPIRNIE